MAKVSREQKEEIAVQAKPQATEPIQQPLVRPVPAICAQGITRAQLKDYLFRRRSAAELDASGKAVHEHVMTGCAGCDQQIIEIDASDPFLRGEPDLHPAVNVKVVRKQPDERLKREALIAELSRKLAAELATPAKSFPLEELSAMNTQIRTVSDTEKRRTIAQRVVDACQARWQRVKAGSGLDPEIEAAAGKLFTFIHTYDGQPEKRECSIEELGITGETRIPDFLLYMMTSAWFVHPEGENTWDLKSISSNSGTEISASAETLNSPPRRTVIFDLQVLKQALQAPYSAGERPVQPGPASV